jgi:hypothetical protein
VEWLTASHRDADAGPDWVRIGDPVVDAHAAGAVGAGCVLYSGGFTDSERLRATGKLVARSVSAGWN